MGNFTTKFDVDQQVWFIKKNQVIRQKIISIDVVILKSRTTCLYHTGHNDLEEHLLFDSVDAIKRFLREFHPDLSFEFV